MDRVMKVMGAVAVLLLLTGCWSRRELNELSIAVAMGLDVAENDRIRVTVQIVNPGEIASGKGGSKAAPVTTFSMDANSIFEAVRKFTTQVNRRIYLSHLRLVVFGEELARRGIADPIDFLSRDHEMRTDYFLVVAKRQKAEDVLKVLTPEEEIPASELFSSLDMSERNWAATGKVTLDRVIEDLESEGTSPALTGLFVDGSIRKGKEPENVQKTSPAAIIRYDGMSVFRTDKLIGWLNEDESKGYHYIQNKVKSTVVMNECRGGRMDVEIVRSSTKVRGFLRKGAPAVRVLVHAEGNVGDVACDLDLSKPESIRQIERMTEDNIRRKINQAVRTVQTRYRSDVFGFGEAMHRAFPGQWKEWKKNWDEHFTDMEVETLVHVKIRRIGTINQSIKSRVRK